MLSTAKLNVKRLIHRNVTFSNRKDMNHCKSISNITRKAICVCAANSLSFYQHLILNTQLPTWSLRSSVVSPHEPQCNRSSLLYWMINKVFLCPQWIYVIVDKTSINFYIKIVLNHEAIWNHNTEQVYKNDVLLWSCASYKNLRSQKMSENCKIDILRFFFWLFTLYIEIHIKKNNVNKSLADRHTFQCIYVCRKRETVLFNGIFLVFFSNSYERTCQINMLQNLVLYDMKWYKVSIVWNKMNSFLLKEFLPSAFYNDCPKIFIFINSFKRIK